MASLVDSTVIVRPARPANQGHHWPVRATAKGLVIGRHVVPGIPPGRGRAAVDLVEGPLAQHHRLALRRLGEQARVAVRNVRRDGMEHLKRMEKDGKKRDRKGKKPFSSGGTFRLADQDDLGRGWNFEVEAGPGDLIQTLKKVRSHLNPGLEIEGLLRTMYDPRNTLALNVGGLMNVQYAIKDGDIYVLEVNPRASRTVPFVAKVIGMPVAKIAARIMAGEMLASFDLKPAAFDHIGVKEAVFPFARFPGVDTVLGPEMKSTGEVMGLDRSFDIAFETGVSAGRSERLRKRFTTGAQEASWTRMKDRMAKVRAPRMSARCTPSTAERRGCTTRTR